MPPPYKRVLVVVAAWLTGLSCGDNPLVATIPVRVEITRSTDTVYVGEVAMRLSARAFNALDEEIPDITVTWTSSTPAVAAVDSMTGAVTGVLTGSSHVSARAGSVSDTALVFVLDVLRLGLPYDTVLLAPGDTFTIPIDLGVAPNRPQPVVRFRGGLFGVATLDSISGLVTAQGNGQIDYVVTADSISAAGRVVVATLADTLSGDLHVTLSGALTVSATWISRAFNHPTLDSRTVFQLRALDPDVHELDFIFINELTGPGTRTLQTMTDNGLGIDPVCFPPGSYALYRQTLGTPIRALSLAGGTLTVTTDRALGGGGRALSGRFDVMLQRTSVEGPAGQIRARGTFVIAITSLGSCPALE